ncbi:hypothetical protein TNCV_183671 [Trichonephila clavipes]|nr:hypothetical protein TNCV_183671 [Trichonephila clavipes]
MIKKSVLNYYVELCKKWMKSSNVKCLNCSKLRKFVNSRIFKKKVDYGLTEEQVAGISGKHIYLYTNTKNDHGYWTQQKNLTQKHSATGQTVNPVERMRGSEAGKQRVGGSHSYSSARKNSSLASSQQ